MTSPVFFADRLDSVANDPKLKKALRTAEQTLPRYGPPATEADRDRYATELSGILRMFGERHLRPYVESDVGSGEQSAKNVCAVLSYTSRLLRKSRVSDFRPIKIIAGKDGEIDVHVDDLLKRVWLEKLSRDPKRVELNELAQRATCGADGLISRKPIIVSLEQAGSGTSEFEEEATWRVRVPAAGPVDEAVRILRSFVLQHRERQNQKNGKRYPLNENSISQEAFTGYVTYLRELLQPSADCFLTLTTIALSDELTDLPLGSVMLFSDRAIDASLARNIHHLCFYVVNAIYKWEGRMEERRSQTEILLSWFRHETVHWVRANSFVVDRLQDANPDIPAAVQSIRDVATMADATIDLIGSSTKSDSNPAELRHALDAAQRLNGAKATVEMLVSCDSFPVVMRAVCMELSLNAFKARAAAIAISLDEEANDWVLRVTSSPHGPNDIDNIELMAGDDDSVQTNFRGIRLIRRVAELFQGTAAWSITSRGPQFEVCARFTLPRIIADTGNRA